MNVDGNQHAVQHWLVVWSGGVDTPLGRENDAAEGLVIGDVMRAGRTATHDVRAIVLTAQQPDRVKIKGLLARMAMDVGGERDLQPAQGFAVLVPRFDLFNLKAGQLEQEWRGQVFHIA